MIDSGTAKNYVKPISELKGVVPVETKFCVSTIHGSNPIESKVFFSMFGFETPFFLLPQLGSFDGIVGLDLMKAANGVIDFGLEKLITDHGSENIYFRKCADVNFTTTRLEIPESVKNKFQKLMDNYDKVFADPVESLPYNTNIIATIRTIDNDPVYSRPYPYPMGLSNFVHKEIEDLLRNGIIKPSRSPYNNPLWVVDKKGVDELGNKKKRLVIDFRKLNDKTIDDKYPIPDITVILSNLGRGKFFTTLDLKSGFHQILLSEKDREKTAFSINNGKFELCRLGFGLKNAPSIFQRAIDDVLRENIGKFLHVYIDDIIIYSETEEDHIKHIEWALKSLLSANMRVSLEKSHFFKSEVEYLGFVVSADGIRTCPAKVEAIANFKEPQNLFELRSFLGLAGYYRRFIKGFAQIASPLTNILKGENGTVSAHRSKNVKVCFNEEQIQAFLKLRQILSSEDVVLLYPDYAKPFELTTDASSFGLGAVLSQNGKPITMISRTLEDGEIDYATNERELLAIVWALKRLRNYLYGVNKIIIYTDHQPLSFAVSDKNTNAKLVRWKSFIEGYCGKIVYLPGKENLVADALSRQPINAIDNVSSSATIHSEESLSNIIRQTNTPVNCYKNQIIIEESDSPSISTIIVFRNRIRHVIGYAEIGTVLDQLRDVININTVNAIHCELTVLAHIQDRLKEWFPSTKFWHAPKFVIDITNNTEQKEIIVAEHCRAHRAVQNVVESVLQDYYFPRMAKMVKEVVSNCSICKTSKYVRHPDKEKLGVTPIPSYPGERIHIDIFSTDRKHYVTAIDKFSKFAIVQRVESRGIVDVTPAILQIINTYPNIRSIYCDNEGSFNSFSIRQLLDSFNIEIANSPPQHSTSNGQVERFHSTLAEIARCLKEERSISDTTELILLATIEYNNTIHSVTRLKPVDAVRVSDMSRDQIKSRLITAQDKQLALFNRNRCNRSYNVGDIVFVKSNRRLGNKISPRYVKRRVQADLGSTLLIRGKIVHKDNIR